VKDKTNLLHCPFCGSSDIEIAQTKRSSGSVGWWRVRCLHCYAEISDNTKKETAKYWNTRTPIVQQRLSDADAQSPDGDGI
jgi:Lar family restriction alleviation protein